MPIKVLTQYLVLEKYINYFFRIQNILGLNQPKFYPFIFSLSANTLPLSYLSIKCCIFQHIPPLLYELFPLFPFYV